MKTSVPRLAIIAAAGLAIAGCAHDYRRHGYVGASIGYAGPYYGWYDNYYYPGVGVYVYERSGARHRWNGTQRHYWQSRRAHAGGTENWSAYGAQRPSQYQYESDRRATLSPLVSPLAPAGDGGSLRRSRSG
ncbi:MAG TPA: hypothetical protein VIC34_06980 [Croceibacterium sp.]